MIYSETFFPVQQFREELHFSSLSCNAAPMSSYPEGYRHQSVNFCRLPGLPVSGVFLCSDFVVLMTSHQDSAGRLDVAGYSLLVLRTVPEVRT